MQAVYFDGRRIVSVELWRPEDGSWSMMVHLQGRSVEMKVRGDLRTLLNLYTLYQCPVGILLDRLEEYPEEAGSDTTLVAAAVEWLRQRHQGTTVH